MKKNDGSVYRLIGRLQKHEIERKMVHIDIVNKKIENANEVHCALIKQQGDSLKFLEALHASDPVSAILYSERTQIYMDVLDEKIVNIRNEVEKHSAHYRQAVKEVKVSVLQKQKVEEKALAVRSDVELNRLRKQFLESLIE